MRTLIALVILSMVFMTIYADDIEAFYKELRYVKRSFDGSGNNLFRSYYGKTGRPFSRFVNAWYADGKS